MAVTPLPARYVHRRDGRRRAVAQLAVVLSPALDPAARCHAHRCDRRPRRWPSPRCVSPLTSTGVAAVGRRAVAQLAIAVAAPALDPAAVVSAQV